MLVCALGNKLCESHEAGAKAETVSVPYFTFECKSKNLVKFRLVARHFAVFECHLPTDTGQYDGVDGHCRHWFKHVSHLTISFTAPCSRWWCSECDVSVGDGVMWQDCYIECV